MVDVSHFDNICGVGWLFCFLEFMIDWVGGSSIVASSSVVTFALVVTCERDREREHLGDDSGDE